MPYVCQSALDLDDQYLDAIFATLSKERITPYVEAIPSGNKAQALALYGYNQSLSALFFELLGNIEVALRNKMHEQLTTLYGRSDWFDEIKKVLHPLRAQSIDEAIKTVDSSGEDRSSGLIISKLSFGFWVSLYEKKYVDSLWIPSLRLIFPKTVKRNTLHDDLVAIRDLRNSIAHHERILKFDLEAKLIKAETILKMICPALHQWSTKRLCERIRECLAEKDAFIAGYQTAA